MSAEENWDDKLEYLRKSRFLYHNDDYLEFLVIKVWRLDKPCNIADFGCGFGYLGLKFLPLLPEGSGYTGYDKAPSLLEEANSIYSDLPYRHNFIKSEVYSVPAEDNSFDVTISHAVLMHLERAEDALHEMVRVTRSGGMVIACDANRNAFNALFYTTGIDNIQERISLGLGQQMNKDIREKIGCRISNCVTCLSPSMDNNQRKHLHETLCNEGLSLPEDFEERRWRDRLKGYGISDKEIQTQLANELELDFRNMGETYHTLFPGLLTWSYGTVSK